MHIRETKQKNSLNEQNIYSCQTLIEEVSRFSVEMDLDFKDLSLCPTCDRIVPANPLIFEGFDFIIQRCPHCKRQSVGLAGKHNLSADEPDLTQHAKLISNPTAGNSLDTLNIEHLRKSVQNFIFYITDNCNSNCAICSTQGCKKQPDTSMAELRKNLVGLKKKWIYLYGGEPTTHPQMFDFIKEIKASGNYPCLFTNGIKLADPENVKKLKRAGIKLVRVSFDGFNTEFYEQFRGGRHELDLKLKAIDNLGKENISIILDTLFIKGHNDDQLPAILEFAFSRPNVWTSSFRPLHVARGTDMCRQAKTQWIFNADEINTMLSRATGTNNADNKRLFNIHCKFIRKLNSLFPFLNMPLAHQNQIIMQKHANKTKAFFSSRQMDILEDLADSFSLRNVLRLLCDSKLRAVAAIFVRCGLNPIAVEGELKRRMNVVKIYQGQIRTPYESLLSSTPAFAPVLRNGIITSYYPD